jgi:hypothetical protein
VSWECQNQIFRNEKETVDDIRLSTRLFNKCLVDQRKFCKDVEPGHMRVQECLEDNMDESGFSEECKSELEDIIAKRVQVPPPAAAAGPVHAAARAAACLLQCCGAASHRSSRGRRHRGLFVKREELQGA